MSPPAASAALVNEPAEDNVSVIVRSWPEASRMFTDHERRLRAAETVTRPVHKIWATLKWGWIPGAVLLVTGASPSSPLGQLLHWLVSNAPN